MKKFGKIMVNAVMAATMAFTTVGSATAANNAVNGGMFVDFDNLVWENNDGTVMNYGRGPVFSDVHPEITDPEYYLKELVQYPENAGQSVYNSRGMPKANYRPEVVAELRKFVNSFDWIHSDELTRAQKVHDRVGNGANGNYYQADSTGFCVLLKGHGVCGDFADEFVYLCNLVGLECVKYTPSQMHAACLLKIGNQWFATDPTSTLVFLSNAKTHPVDFETEYHQFEKECEAEWENGYAEGMDNPAMFIQRVNLEFAAGKITEAELDAEIAKLMAYMAGK